mgnify:CR=1 FL=1
MSKIPKERDVMKGINILTNIDTDRPYREIAKAWNKYVKYTRRYDSTLYFEIVDKLFKEDRNLEIFVNCKLELIEKTLIVGQYVREA